MSLLPLDKLLSGARKLGVMLSDEQLAQMDEFARILVETNLTMNLTRIVEPDDIVTAHYLDSLTCLCAKKIKPGAKIIDIGAGAGFPGVPIAIARPDISVTLLDSSKKKLDFAARACAEIGISNVSTLWARAEAAGRDADHRDIYDVALTRALADMKVLVELCMPLVRVGGHLIAQKSADSQQEIDAARAIIGQLGGFVEKVKKAVIPGTCIERQLVVIYKSRQTPAEFPREYGRITKKSAGAK